ncbi:hypothetical protein Atai01_25410 [Amycolatopsis taiwanensis]|uniref:non-specific serine/threonine protein kinase n=1 Tax=Amycolatopsis taiwanensis TaxID=342230 RepID=A0A9W6R1L4_9PSEU|nr:hypothetical protein Atai01_25410 [Amycolatopsis taiwanensis]
MTGERAADETPEDRESPAPDEQSNAPAEEKPFQDSTSATDADPATPETSEPVTNVPADSDALTDGAATDTSPVEPSLTDESTAEKEPPANAAATEPSVTAPPATDAPAPTTEQDRLIADRYRIVRRIGAGAMGVVYLGHDQVLDRTVALKELLLSPTFSKDEAEHARKRSFREARLSARLQHRHAITVFNVVEDDGKPVLVMEYLASKSLAETLAEQRSLPPEQVARIGAEAASALAAAHEAGIVHRDVKPGNILIGENGCTKITDFGISRATDDGTLTGSGHFAGTPAFLAPEAARGEQPSQAADVFSLGATLYTAVEGRFPYGQIENQMALLYAAAAGRYTPPSQAGPLTGVLTRMMALDPAERPTMAEAARELAGVLTPEPPPRRSRRKLFAGLSLVVVVAAAVTAALILLPGTKNQNAAPPANSPSMTATAPPSELNVSPSAPPTSTHTTVTTTTVTTAPPASSSAGSLVDAVAEYYPLLNGNLDAAWARLGPDLQKVGRSGYARYWSDKTAVAVVGTPEQIGQNTVKVTIQYNWNGSRVQETHTLGMIVVDGKPLINTDPGVPHTTVG